MSIEIVSFAVGSVLVLIGILGGGFEVKEIKIPKVGMGVRIVALLAGGLFVCLGIGETPAAGDKLVPASPVYAAQPDKPVDFTVIDDLGRQQISEQITLLIDGKNVGNLTVNQEYPHSSITVNVSKPGQHSFHAEAAAVFNENGIRVEYPGAGQGMIDVQPGKTYSLRGTKSGDTWLVTLEQEP